MIGVEIVNKSNNPLPVYATAGAAGMDVRASFTDIDDIKFFEGGGEIINGVLHVEPLSRFMVPTGLYMAIEEGNEAQVRSRSGKSLKEGLTVVQGVGTIDCDYRGECKVCLVNLSAYPREVRDGERIAQFVFNKVEKAELTPVAFLNDTTRGSGGFGHTGKL